MKANDIYSRVTFGSGTKNEGDGIHGSPPSGLQLNEEVSPEVARAALRLIARHVTPGEWQAIADEFPELADVLMPRTD